MVVPFAALAALATMIGTLAFSTCPALAVAPEAPQLEVKSRAAESVSLRGVVNPGKEGEEAGTYQFVYRQTTEKACKGTGEVKVPATPGLSVGFQGQEVFETLSGLKPGTEYAVCLIVENGKKEAATSATVPFTTAIPPETPRTEPATHVTAATATLTGTLNPNNPGEAGTYEFLYKQSASECEITPEERSNTVEQKRTPQPAGISSAGSPQPVSTEITGLLPARAYTFCLRAVNAAGEAALSAPETFTTQPAAPVVEESFVTHVTATSATLGATLNPEGADTTYRFETATAGGTFAPVRGAHGETLTGAEGDAGQGIQGVSLEVHIQNLAPNSSYRYRLTATSTVQGAIAGSAQTFTTEPTGSTSTLPDGRQYELVTPPQKQGALFKQLIPTEHQLAGGTRTETVVQASVAGGAIVDEATLPPESEPQGYSTAHVSVLSTRGASGWSSQVLTPPHTEPTGVGSDEGGEYREFSDDLARGILQPFGNFNPLLSPEASESTAFLRTVYADPATGTTCSSGCYQPLVTTKNDTTVPFQPFGEKFEEKSCYLLFCGPRFVAGTPDMSHIILSSQVQLTPTPTHVPGGTKPALYEWSSGKLSLVSVLPDGEAGNLELAGSDSGEIASGDARRSISNDGERVMLEDPVAAEHGSSGYIYLREHAMQPQSPLNESGECTEPADACTVRVDVAQGGPEGSVEPRYMSSASDGSKVFFLDAGRLTPGSTASGPTLGPEVNRRRDLYEYDATAPLGARLTDLTDNTSGGESAGVRRLGRCHRRCVVLVLRREWGAGTKRHCTTLPCGLRGP